MRAAVASSFRAARADVAACQKECDARLGVRPAWFRPPMGVVSPAGLAAARANGLGTMTWSLDANDWQCRSAAQAAACGRAAAAAARPGDIVLFHDGQPWIGHVLAAALPALRRRGLA